MLTGTRNSQIHPRGCPPNRAFGYPTAGSAAGKLTAKTYQVFVHPAETKTHLPRHQVLDTDGSADVGFTEFFAFVVMLKRSVPVIVKAASAMKIQVRA